MSIAELEQTVIDKDIERCELGRIASLVIGHPDFKILYPRWSSCIECQGYDSSCPRHPNYRL